MMTRLNIAILKDGRTDYVFDIEVDVSALNKFTSKGIVKKTAKKPTIFEKIKKASTIISLVTGLIKCEVAIGAALASSGILAPTVLVGCSSLAVTITTIIIDKIDVDKNVSQGAGLFALGLSFISCKKELNFEDCQGAVVGAIEKIKALIENLASSNTDEEIDTAKGNIEVGENSNTITLTGDLKFIDVKLGESEERLFSIRNNSDEEVIVSKIDTPDGFSLDWSSGKILAKQYQPVIVTFSPTKLIEYKGDIVVTNDLDSDNNKIYAIGKGNAIISLTGSLDFNEVAIGTSVSNFFVIENHSRDKNVTVSAIEFIDVPADNFKIEGWSSGTIASGGKKRVEVVFTPTDETSYSGSVKVINNVDQVNNTLAIIVTGKQSSSAMKLIGDLNFGNINIGETAVRTFVIENLSLNDKISVSNIELPDGYTANWTNGQIEPSAYQEVEISFSPTENKAYKGTILVNNDLDQNNNSIEVTGLVMDIENSNKIEIISGNNQTGVIEDVALPKFLKVKVTNHLGQPSRISVKFKIIEEGGGSLGYSRVNSKTVTTNYDGIAEISWTLGNTELKQQVEVSVAISENSDMTTSVRFNATLDLAPTFVLGMHFYSQNCNVDPAPKKFGSGIILLPNGKIKFYGRNYSWQNQYLVESTYSYEDEILLNLSYLLVGEDFTEKVTVTSEWSGYIYYKGETQITRTGTNAFSCTGTSSIKSD